MSACRTDEELSLLPPVFLFCLLFQNLGMEILLQQTTGLKFNHKFPLDQSLLKFALSEPNTPLNSAMQVIVRKALVSCWSFQSEKQFLEDALQDCHNHLSLSTSSGGVVRASPAEPCCTLCLRAYRPLWHKRTITIPLPPMLFIAARDFLPFYVPPSTGFNVITMAEFKPCALARSSP